MPTHSKLIFVSASLTVFGPFATAFGESFFFQGNASPALQAVAAQDIGPSGHPSQVLDSVHRTFVAVYDTNGRLTSLKNSSGRNIADMAVNYDTTGRIRRVQFDNGYELVFHYRSDGTEEIRDSLGARLVRVGSPWVTQSRSDPSGYLVQTLERVERMFGFLQPVLGLNVTAASNSLDSSGTP